MAEAGFRERTAPEETFSFSIFSLVSFNTEYSKEEMEQLLRDLDAHVKEYKETNEGWL